MDKSNYELNEWQKKTGEDSFEYEERMSDKINLKSIKQRFNYNTFSELLEKKNKLFGVNIFEAIQKSCNADEHFWLMLKDGRNDGSNPLDRPFIDGSFFSFVSNNLIEYIPVAEWSTPHDSDDNDEDARENKFGLLKFKKPLKYVMVEFNYYYPGGNSFDTKIPFLKFDEKKKINNNTIKKYISEIIKEESFSPKFIYLNEKFDWDIKSFVRNIPEVNLFNITTKLWLTDFSKKSNFQSPQPKEKPDFSNKFPTD